MKKFINRLFALFLILYIANDISAQKQKDYLTLYKDKVTDSSLVAIEAGINYLILKDQEGRFVLQNYYYETLNMYRQTTYKNKERTILHGPMIRKDDEGNLLTEGFYESGQMSGVWKYYVFDNNRTYLAFSGSFVKNKQEGLWIRTDTAGLKTREEIYVNGILEKTTKFNPDGTENQVPDSTDTSDQKVPAFPCNPLYQSKDTDCGGTSLMMYLRDHIIYPESARKLGIEGTASLNFVVEKDGSVAQVQIINGISDAIKKECLRIVSEMPKWTPGSANGVPVKVKYTLPIRFRLE